MSDWTATMRRPYCSRSAATSRNCSRSRAATIRSQPALASPRAKLTPSPRETPVTIAALPVRSNCENRLGCMSISHLYGFAGGCRLHDGKDHSRYAHTVFERGKDRFVIRDAIDEVADTLIDKAHVTATD